MPTAAAPGLGTPDLGSAAFLEEGDQYLKAALGGLRRPQVFTPEILYNLLAMAVEKHFMALLTVRGTLPENHTFTDLVDAARQVVGLDADLEAELLALETFQNLCPAFDGYARTAPDTQTIDRLVAAALRVQSLAQG